MAQESIWARQSLHGDNRGQRRQSLTEANPGLPTMPSGTMLSTLPRYRIRCPAPWSPLGGVIEVLALRSPNLVVPMTLVSGERCSYKEDRQCWRHGGIEP
jgi:hypothetical protein